MAHSAAGPTYAWGECPAGAPSVAWQLPFRGYWAERIAGGLLVLESGRTRLLRLADGGMLWEAPADGMPDELSHDPAGILVAVGPEVRSVDPATGAVVWRQRPGAVVDALALDGATGFAAARGSLYALDRTSGQTRWRARCGREVELHPHSSAGLLVVEEVETQALRAIRAVDGEPLWEYTAEGSPVAAGPMLGGALLVSAHEAGAVALDVTSGACRWRLESGAAFEAPAVGDDERAYLTDGTVYAVDHATGDIVWRRGLDDDADRIFSLRLAASLLFAETWRGRLLALDPETGSPAWESVPGQVHGLAESGGVLYLRVQKTGDRPVWAAMAVEAGSGALLWELTAERMIRDVTAGEGRVVVELRDGVVALAPG